jgi:hypothetical protein
MPLIPSGHYCDYLENGGFSPRVVPIPCTQCLRRYVRYARFQRGLTVASLMKSHAARRIKERSRHVGRTFQSVLFGVQRLDVAFQNCCAGASSQSAEWDRPPGLSCLSSRAARRVKALKARNKIAQGKARFARHPGITLPVKIFSPQGGEITVGSYALE